MPSWKDMIYVWTEVFLGIAEVIDIQRGYVINDSEYISLSHVIITVYNLMYVWTECTPWGSIEKVTGYQYNCDPSIMGRYNLDSFWRDIAEVLHRQHYYVSV